MEGKRIRRTTEDGRGLLVYLPPSYADGSRSYPVVYVQDGGETVYDIINYIEHLMRLGRLREMIFVGVETADRSLEYTPWPAAGLAPGAQGFGGGGDRYAEELAQRVKPYVDREFRTKPGPAHTGLVGCSLGGLISLYAHYRCPGVFGRIALLSASFWYAGILDYVRTTPLPGAGDDTRLFLSVGALEGIYKRNSQRGMVEGTKTVYETLRAHGLSDERLRLVVDEAGTHDLAFFALRLPEALMWLFGGATGEEDGTDEIAG